MTRRVHTHGLCGPDCGYKPLYEGSQASLSDMAGKQASALSRVARLRQGIIMELKQAFPVEFADAERQLGSRMSSLDDEVLLAYLSGFLTMPKAQTAIRQATARSLGAGTDTTAAAAEDVAAGQLRSALSALGVPLPVEFDLASWAAAVAAWGDKRVPPQVSTAPPIAPGRAPRISVSDARMDAGTSPFDSVPSAPLDADQVSAPRAATLGSVGVGSAVAAAQAYAAAANGTVTGAVADLPPPQGAPVLLDPPTDTSVPHEEPEWVGAGDEGDSWVAGGTGIDEAPAIDSDFWDGLLEEGPNEAEMWDDLEPPVVTGAPTASHGAGLFGQGGFSVLDTDAPAPDPSDLSALFDDPDDPAPTAHGRDSTQAPSGEEGAAGGVGPGGSPRHTAPHRTPFGLGDSDTTGSTSPDLGGPARDTSTSADPGDAGQTSNRRKGRRGGRGTGRGETGQPVDADKYPAVLGPPSSAPAHPATTTLPVAEAGPADLPAPPVVPQVDSGSHNPYEEAVAVAAFFDDAPAEAVAAPKPRVGSTAPGGVTEPVGSVNTRTSGPIKPIAAMASPVGTSAIGRGSSKASKQTAKPAGKPGRKPRVSASGPGAADHTAEFSAAAAAGVVTEELRTKFQAVASMPRPVFVSDLAEMLDNPQLAGQLCDEYRAMGATGPFRFINPKSRHKDRGALILPFSEELRHSVGGFDKSQWAKCVQALRGAKLYELAVVLHKLLDQVVTLDIGTNVVSLRVNQQRGLVGVVVVLDSDIEPGSPTRDELGACLEEMSSGRLSLMAVCTYAGGPRAVPDLAQAAKEELDARGVKPSCPVIAQQSWAFASDGGTSAVSVL